MNKLKILVTGSNGLLGQKIVYQLVKEKILSSLQLQKVLIDYKRKNRLPIF